MIVNQDSGYLMIDIANIFASSGRYDNVAFVAGRIVTIKTRLNEKIKVNWITTYNRSNAINRPWSWIKATLQILFLCLFKYKDYELLLTSNPPTIPFAMLFCRNSYSVLIFDVYPDGLVSSKFITRNSLIYKVWAKANKNYFYRAEKVFTLTEGMANVIAQYTDRSKVRVIPVWPSTDIDKLSDKLSNPFIINNHLEGKFIVQYSGNLGKGHNLDVLITLAEKFKNESEIIFLIIGDGWARDSLVNLTEVKSLKNVIFLPKQPADNLSQSLSAADLAFVSIEPELDKVCIPSKLYNVVRLGIPVLSVAREGSELFKTVMGNGMGLCFESHQTEQMISYIIRLKEDKVYHDGIIENLSRYSKKTTNNVKLFLE